MNSRLSAVMQRRGELLARIALQREQLAEVEARLQAPLALVDRSVVAVRFMWSNPVLAAGAGVIAVLVIRRCGVIGAASVLWRAWKRYRFFKAIAAKLSS